jgi:hypothetical protein
LNNNTIYIPDGCPPDCPVLQSTQSTAMAVAAQAQSLFQGFLKCLHQQSPDNQFDPDSKKGATMLGHFTNKLDNALAAEFVCSTQCSFVRDGGSCPYDIQKKLNQQLDDNQSRYTKVVDKNQDLLSRCTSLETQVDKLRRDLSKRRSQYNNRILVQIFEDNYATLITTVDGSFFDLVPREQLVQFLPFLRNIVLGPATANKYDEDLSAALLPFRDNNGYIDIDIWEDVLASPEIVEIMQWIAHLLFQRSQRKDAFRSILLRNSPISQHKMPTLLALFESFGLTSNDSILA